jgi:hypothetical protein
MSRYYADPATRPKIDPSVYSLQPDELAFFQHLTGIQDEQALKEHILSVQAKAYDLYGYPCIRRFVFLRLKIARLPGYPQALKLLQERKDPILLDIGCCFGNDVRKAVVDGWPVQNVIASDLRQGFWDYGHELFKSTPETFPAAFIPGDVFDPSVLSLTASPSSDPLPPLATLKSLTPLLHRLSAIHASSFFHLFSEEQQLALAKRLAALLLPQPGSIIFGQNGASPVKGIYMEPRLTSSNDGGASIFRHSPESWREMWTEEVFGPDQPVRVQVDTKLMKRSDLLKLFNQTDTAATEGGHATLWIMIWSVRVV